MFLDLEEEIRRLEFDNIITKGSTVRVRKICGFFESRSETSDCVHAAYSEHNEFRLGKVAANQVCRYKLNPCSKYQMMGKHGKGSRWTEAEEYRLGTSYLSVNMF